MSKSDELKVSQLDSSRATRKDVISTETTKLIEQLQLSRRQLSDELISTRLKLRKAECELKKYQNTPDNTKNTSNFAKEVETLRDELIRANNQFSSLTERQNNEIKSLKTQLEEKESATQSISDISDIETQLNHFAKFLSKNIETDRFHKLIPVINSIKTTAGDTDIEISNKISQILSATATIIMNIQHPVDNSTSVIANYEEIVSKQDDLNSKDNQIQELKTKLEKAKDQIKKEHIALGNFSKVLAPKSPSVRILDDENYFSNQIQIIQNSIQPTEEINDLRSIALQILGKRSSHSSDASLIHRAAEKLENKYTQYIDFVDIIRTSLGLKNESVSLKKLIDNLRETIEAMPQLQIDISKITDENEALKVHNNEMEAIIQKQASKHKELKEESENMIKQLELEIKEMKEKLDEAENELKTQQQAKSKLKAQTTEISNLSEKMEELTQIAAQKSTEVENLVAQLQFEADNHQRALKSVQDKSNQLEVRIRELNEDLSEQNQQNSKLQQLIQGKDQIIEDFKRKAKEFESRVEEFNIQAAKAKKSNQKLVNALQLSEQKYERASKEIHKLKKANESLKHQVEQLTDEKSTLHVMNEELEDQLQASQLKYEDLETQLQETEKSFSQLESTTCAKTELDQCYSEIQAKEQTIRQLKSLIASQEASLAVFQQKQSINEEIQVKLDEANEKIRQKASQIQSIGISVKALHSHMSLLNSSNPTVAELIKVAKPIFDAFSLPFFSYSFNNLSLISFRVFNTRPSVDSSEILTLKQKQMLSDILEELSSLPIDRTELFNLSSSSGINEKLDAIYSLISFVRRVLEERDESLTRMSALVSSQHSAIVKMTQGRDLSSSFRNISPKK